MGREKKDSLPLSDRNYKTHRLRLKHEKGVLFYLSFNWKLFRFLRKQKFDVLIANDLDTMPACYAALLFRRAKLIYDSHELFTEVPELIHRPLKQFIWKCAERLTIRRVDAGITVSDSVAGILEKRYGKKMTVIRNLPFSYDYSGYVGQEKYIIADPDRFRILFYQGSVNVSLGLEEMVEAMAFLPLCKLFIAGSGDVEEALKAKFSLLEWRDRIVFLGRISPEELRFYTVQADLGLSVEKMDGQSYAGALPNKFFDYIQAGVPVLISSLPELVRHNEQFHVAEVIPDHSPQGISNAILHLFAEEGKMDLLRKNVAEARKVWTWENEAGKLIRLISDVTGRGV